MPKRQAIVPQMARAPKRSKKKKAIAEASNNEDEPPGSEAEEDQRPPAEAGELLSLVHEQAPEATGHAIVSLPDAADKPERFFGWLIAPMTPQDFFDDMHERRPFHVQRPQQAEYYHGWLGRKRIDALERTVETLTDRLTHDPHLAASLHDMLSTVTSIRSTAGILAETGEIEPEWRDRFHRNINEDARRLAESSTALVRYLDSADSEANLTSPQEEVEAFLEENAYHFPVLEEGSRTVDEIVDGSASLTMAASRDAMRRYLSRYARDVTRIPPAPLRDFVAAQGFDPAALAQAFDAPLGSALHRLATLPAEAGLGPLGLVICDASGTLLFRKPLDEFPLPRFGAACALWPLFTALTRPAQPIYRLVEQSAREARRFETFSVAEPTGGMRFGDVARIEAVMLFRPSFDSQRAGQTGQAPVPIGVSCRICARTGCSARREPSVLAEGL